MRKIPASVNMEHANKDGRPPDVTAILVTMATDAVCIKTRFYTMVPKRLSAESIYHVLKCQFAVIVNSQTRILIPFSDVSIR